LARNRKEKITEDKNYGLTIDKNKNKIKKNELILRKAKFIEKSDPDLLNEVLAVVDAIIYDE